MKHLLITGATGFLGSWLTRRLLNDGVHVTAVVRSTSTLDLLPCNDDRLAILGSKSHAIAQTLESLAHDEHFDAVVHFATNYGRDNTSVTGVVETNVVYSLKLLEWSIQREIPTFVNIDTCFTPDYPYLQPYTLSKKQFATWGRLLCNNALTKFANLVLQHPFGPGDRAGKFVPWIINQCLRNVPSIDLTSGEQEKDFIYVDDVAEACLCVVRNADALPPGASSYDVGRGEAVSVRAFVELIHELSHSTSELRFGALQQRPGEVMRSIANTEPLKKLGWRPAHALDAGIMATLRACSENHKLSNAAT